MEKKKKKEIERILSMTYNEVCQEDDNDYNERVYGDSEDC